MSRPLPLCVDCDGTLISTDLLHESVFLLLKQSWLNIFRLPFWLLKGRAFLKQAISERIRLDPALLPYRQEVLQLLRDARQDGRTTVLATASTSRLAQQIADHLGLFDQVLASDGTTNLKGEEKARCLVARFGSQGYEYVGDSRADLPVWQAGSGGVCVGGSSGLQSAARQASPAMRFIPAARPGLRDYLRAIRVHQWLKNLLVFVPLFAAHRASVPHELMLTAGAFLAFSCCASAVYVINDLLDLPSDRRHARKRNRPFASGRIPISHGAALVPLLLGSSALACTWLPPAFSLTLLCYFAITCLYSFWLKNQVVVDVILLCSLYTLRIIAGGAATGIHASFWLLAFSMFIFLSMAAVKRYSEMLSLLQQDQLKAAGRGYMVSDMPVLMSMGTAAGYIAILILALYVNSPDLKGLYPNAWALWMILPPMLYWISRVWMKTHRGEMNDDPVVFAASDRQSWILAVLIGAAFWVAAHPELMP